MSISKIMNAGIVCLLLASMAQAQQAGTGNSAVKIREEPMIIPTYLVGSIDPNPIFYTGRAYQGAQGKVYPYPMMDRLTDVKEDRTYRAVILENEYVKLCVLPEIGGRIFSALDKTNGYDFFYRQHVIKPALIGMLGAWISGGVEWNVPHHHRATSFMNVDYKLEENDDGSGTIWVGEQELRHRMKWIVGLTLRPGCSCIEVSIKVINPTPLPHSFLCWANVAVHTNEAYQVIFPSNTAFAAFHGKNQFSRWPVSYQVYNRSDFTKGVDVSWWKNHSMSTSMFAFDCAGEFLAGYDHGKGGGVVFVADHHMVPGKKFWTWGTGPGGQRWERILTDEDGPYLELMVGAWSDNQPDYSWIHPYETKTVMQHWFPLRALNGVKKANRHAAVNLEVADGEAFVGFNTTTAQADCRAVLKLGEAVLCEERIEIGPKTPYVNRIPLPAKFKEEALHLALMDSKGKELVAYRPTPISPSPMPEPVKPPPSPEKIKTIEELYLAGRRLEQFHSPALEPYPYYEEALRRDPGDSRTNTALAVLDLERGLFVEAEKKLRRAITRTTHNYTRPENGAALYYLGVASRALGNKEAAVDAFNRAAWDFAFYGAAQYQLSEMACEEGAFSKAMDHLERSLSADRMNTRALGLQATVLRKQGRFEASAASAAAALTIDPLDFRAGNELALAKEGLGLKDEALAALAELKSRMRGEVQSYLELAVDYGRCGAWDEATDVLTRWIESSDDRSPVHPMAYYYRGFFLERSGRIDEARADYRSAARMPPDYCFPHRIETIGLLRHVMHINPDDARAPYYLGNLLYDLQPEAAIEAWERSRRLDPGFATVHRNLGQAYARVKHDVAEAASSLEKAIECDPKDSRLVLELDLLYEMNGTAAEKRLAVLEKNLDTVISRGDALSRLVSLYVLVGRYDRALEILTSHHFNVWEGGSRIHNHYANARLLSGREKLRKGRIEGALKDFEAALDYPENLEAGEDQNNPRIAQVYYLIGMAHEAGGSREKALTSYKTALQVQEISEGSAYRYYQGLASRKIGREEEACKQFEGLIEVGGKRLGEDRAMDFFAKFGEREAVAVRRAQAHYLVGLGNLGMGDLDKSKAAFQEALKLNPNHLWARAHLVDMR